MTFDPERECIHECVGCHYLFTHLPPCEGRAKDAPMCCPVCAPDLYIHKSWPKQKKDAA